MSVFKQTGDGDLQLTNGKLTQSTEAEETAFRLRNRLFSVKGEWFADARIGIPYLELIFVKNPNMGLVYNVYAKAFAEIPGVAKVDNLTLDVDKDTRHLVVTTEITHQNGAKIVGGSGTPFIVEEF